MLGIAHIGRHRHRPPAHVGKRRLESGAGYNHRFACGAFISDRLQSDHSNSLPPSSPPATSRRRSSDWSTASRPGSRTRPCSASPARARPSRSPTSSSAVQRPTLVLAPNKTLAAQLYGEFKEFFPHNAVEYFVSYYDYYQPEAYVPSHRHLHREGFLDQRAHRADAPVGDQGAARAHATRSSSPRCRASTASASRRTTSRMVLHLVRGDRIDQRELMRRLDRDAVRAQRHRAAAAAPSACAATSSTCSRPRSRREAVRIELFDDEVENLSLFDPLTGEVMRKRAALHGLSRHALRDHARDACSTRSRRSRTSCRSACSSCTRTTSWSRRSACEQRTQFDLEMIARDRLLPRASRTTRAT